mgnify:CR=1 FL=1
MILADAPVLEPRHFALGPSHARPDVARPGGDAAISLTTLSLAAVEREVIAQALHRAGGNRTRAAQLLAIDVRTLRRKLNQQAGGSSSDS